MEKQEPENTKKSLSSSNYVYPTFNELSKSSAIHGATMGNLSGIREGSILYRTSDGTPVLCSTQLVTFSRDIIRIYNVEIITEQSKVPSRVVNHYRLNLTHEFPLFGEVKKVSTIYNTAEENRGYLVVLFTDYKVLSLPSLVDY